MKTIICYTDGASRGNPGPGAVGVYITDADGVMMSEEAQTIGNTTTDFAKYNAVLIGLQTLTSLFNDETKTLQFDLRLDNELIKKQLNAESQIKEPGFVPMFIEIHNMRVASFPHLTLTLITADQNKAATQLVNEALDAPR